MAFQRCWVMHFPAAAALALAMAAGCSRNTAVQGQGDARAADSQHAAATPPVEPGEKIPANLGSMVEIPGGWFIMGDDRGKVFERPAHKVFVDPFLLDVYAVTNLEYWKFVRAAGRPAPPHWTGGTYGKGRALHPVTNVTWEDACAYAAWAGKRLPTEAEWEFACRGPDSRRFAYGNEFNQKITNSGYSGICDTVPVDAFPEGMSVFGCYNMTGNVWEWVSDWFLVSYYKDKDGQKNPKGPASGTMRVSKGGSWTTDDDSCRAAYKCRSLPGARWGYCGFRCARSVKPAPGAKPPARDMVLIPAGHFLMGSDDYTFEYPRRKIHLDAYFIDRLPVTNEDYFLFCASSGHAPPPHWHAGCFPEGEEKHPVCNVTIDDARAYAAWAGKRLPTEAEWEKAARGEDGRAYPWGNEFDPKKCNTEMANIGHTVPVGSYPDSISPFGVSDMCGNVWEWVDGFWHTSWFEEAPDRNHKGPPAGDMNVLRGGTWSTHYLNCRTFSRCPALKGCRWGYCGFRCAADAPAGGGGDGSKKG